MKLIKYHVLLLVLLCWGSDVFAITQIASGETRLAPPLSQQGRLKALKGAGAETLYSINSADLDDQDKWTQRSYYSIRINDQEAARDYGRIAISYNHYYADTQLDFANVMSAKGEVKAVSEDAVQLRVVGGGQDFYDDRSEIVFSLPDVAPGSIIEFQFHSTTKRRAITTVESDRVSPYWFQRRVANDGWRADAVHHFFYTRSEPLDKSFFTDIYGSFTPNATVTEQSTRRVSKWHWQNIPSTALESSMLPSHEVLPGIVSSTSRDWALVDAWSWAKVADKFADHSPEMRKALAAIKLPKNATREQKIRAVYTYMQNNIRYVFAHLGRGGYEPHFPHEVIRNGYGDCKDQTVLATALLRQLGVDAYPVLVETPGAGKSKTNLVRLIFDHMLVWIAPSEQSPAVWMDTTGDRALYPGFSNYLQQQPALVINGQGGILTQVEASTAPNIATLDLEYAQNDKGQTVVDAVYSGSGIYEEYLRQWWKQDNNRDTSLQQLLGGIFENKGQYTVTREVINTENLFEPTKVTARFVFNEPESDDKVSVYATSFSQLYSMVGEARSLQLPATRKNVWRMAQGIELQIRSRFVGQKGRVPALLKNPTNVSNPYFSLEQQGHVEGNDYLINIDYKRPPLTLSVSEYSEYYRALLDLANLSNWVVSMAKDPRQAAETEVANVEDEHGEQSAEYQMALTRKHIDSGEFTEALVPAREAVRLRPDSGEAWYLLGTAQGFNALIEESNASFKKASELGYVP